jgi:hypothetical protein
VGRCGEGLLGRLEMVWVVSGYGGLEERKIEDVGLFVGGGG